MASPSPSTPPVRDPESFYLGDFPIKKKHAYVGGTVLVVAIGIFSLYFTSRGKGIVQWVLYSLGDVKQNANTGTSIVIKGADKVGNVAKTMGGRG